MATTIRSSVSALPLCSGSGEIPALGLGVCASSQCEQSALAALQAGYRHLDTAQIYFNERETGSAISVFLSQNAHIKRSQIFICSKLWEVDLSRPEMPKSFQDLIDSDWPLNSLKAGHTTYTRSGAVAGLHRSLNAIGLEYLDLFLLHNPRPGPKARVDAWLGLQDELAAGKVRAIGVSNWAPRHIEGLMAHPDVHTLPAVNQIECHPWNQQREIVKYCKAKGIAVVAYSPLTQGKRLDDAVIQHIAQKHHKTPAQVVLRWCLQQGIAVIPKTDREQRIHENMVLSDWELDDSDMQHVDNLDEGQKGNIGEWDPFAWE
ncbi:Aldo/keto reductase [Polychaeton citri CBS 116435]|uniref:Aldo/keto reductase n=1 Tax=Polychaeton citri CBS 116435 TaxID=1314669 RepID=A0A9P4QB40_9PEZI|nr:Aldo/keto reductase [Polychaeton citri CBS 116435]